jgi:hypothetical protein
MNRSLVKKLMIIIISIIISACASNNASKVKEARLFEITKTNHFTPPKPELHIIFQVNKNTIELIEILPSNIKRENLVNLLKKNEGKNFSRGDTLVDCIILTGNNNAKPCFESAKKNIPENSVFHESEVSGTLLVMTALVPYLAFGAASDGDFYVENKIDGELVNSVGVALRSEISDARERIHKSLLSYQFINLTEKNRAYGQLIDHDVLVESIKRAQTQSQIDEVEKILNGIEYEGFIVKSVKINQREKPTIRSKVQTKHKRGELILAESTKDGWIYNGEGWIYKKILLSLNDDARTKLLHKRNNLKLDKHYQNLISGNSIAAIDKILKNNSELVGISQKKINQLKLKKYQLIDEKEYKRTLKEKSIVAYERYIALQPNGKYVDQVKRDLSQLEKIQYKNKISIKRRNIDKGKVVKCAALVWGPDACGMLAQEAAERVGEKVYNIASSPTCSMAVNDVLNHPFSKEDLEFALFTGGLDDIGDAGLESDSIVMNGLGILSKLTSFSAKISMFEKCTNQ